MFSAITSGKNNVHILVWASAIGQNRWKISDTGKKKSITMHLYFQLKLHASSIMFFTEPCPPSNVMVNASCEDHGALVTWSPSPVAETYHVVAMGSDGHVHNCSTSSSNCSLSDLHCGRQYTVFVTASHENCTSKASDNVTINTGICLIH